MGPESRPTGMAFFPLCVQVCGVGEWVSIGVWDLPKREGVKSWGCELDVPSVVCLGDITNNMWLSVLYLKTVLIPK